MHDERRMEKGSRGDLESSPVIQHADRADQLKTVCIAETLSALSDRQLEPLSSHHCECISSTQKLRSEHIIDVSSCDVNAKKNESAGWLTIPRPTRQWQHDLDSDVEAVDTIDIHSESIQKVLATSSSCPIQSDATVLKCSLRAEVSSIAGMCWNKDTAYPSFV